MSENTQKKTARAGGFLKAVKGEFKKIVWPEKKNVLRNTGVVIGFVILISVLVFILDTIFGGIFTWAVNLLK
jgi:preprotein translocase subunit SecE